MKGVSRVDKGVRNGAAGWQGEPSGSQRRAVGYVRVSTDMQRPGLSKLAMLLAEAGYQTPRGRSNWWPAQVQQLLDGRFDSYYKSAVPTR